VLAVGNVWPIAVGKKSGTKKEELKAKIDIFLSPFGKYL
jgi:hypothetical protein